MIALRLGRGRAAQPVPLRTGCKITAVGQRRRQQFARVFVRGIHQDVLAVLVLHSRDGVVEITVGYVVVLGDSGHDQHGIRLEPGDLQHGRQQRRFVAAHSVAPVERHRHVVGFIARRLRLRRDPHVADLLRNEIEQRPDFFPVRLFARRQFLHFGADGVVRRIQTGTAQRAVPLGDIRPALRRSHQQPLHRRVQRRHVRLRDRLRHVDRFPPVMDPVARGGFPEFYPGSGTVLYHLGLQRLRLRSIDHDDVFLYRHISLQGDVVPPEPGDAGLLDDPPDLDPDDVIELHLGDRQRQHLVGRIVNVAAHLPRIDGDFCVFCRIQQLYLALAQNEDLFHRQRFVGRIEVEGKTPQLPAPRFRQRFLIIFVGRIRQPVRLVADLFQIVKQHRVGIRELLFRRLVSQLQQFLLRQILRRNRLHRKQQQNKKPYHLSHSDLRLFSLVTSISRI